MPVKRIHDKITATSTPNNVYKQSSDYPQRQYSPIYNRQKNVRSKNSSLSNQHDSSSSDYSDEWSESEITTSLKTSKSICGSDQISKQDVTKSYASIVPHFFVTEPGWVCISMGIILILVVFGIKSLSSDININSSTLIEVQKKFPSQQEDVWDAITSGINEVKTFKKPSVFILLYDNEASKTVDLFLHAVSRYAAGILNENYNTEPIILTSNNLTSIKARTDYGYIIAKYKPELEKKSVMVVKNLDKIPGEVAQAFHSMCDEITPLVGKTMFLFTIHLKNFISEKSDYEVVENLLRKSWRDLDDDIFYPLFTRLSSMILRIEPENSL